jgi:hypothetical protein
MRQIFAFVEKPAALQGGTLLLSTTIKTYVSDTAAAATSNEGSELAQQWHKSWMFLRTKAFCDCCAATIQLKARTSALY